MAYIRGSQVSVQTSFTNEKGTATASPRISDGQTHTVTVEHRSGTNEVDLTVDNNMVTATLSK